MTKSNFQLALQIIVASLFFLSGCGGGTKVSSRVMGPHLLKGKRDTIKEIVPVADDLATYQPKPVWETRFSADETDLMEILPGDRLLIGLIQLSSRLAVPEYGDLVMYDTKTGHQIWNTSRPDLENGSYALLATRPLIVIVGENLEKAYYMGIDPANGAKMWELETKKPLALAEDNELLVLLAPDKKSSELKAIKLADGTVSWTLKFAKAKAAELINDRSLIFHGGFLYLANNDLYKISPINGEVLWQKPLPQDDAATSITPAGDTLLVWDMTSLSAVSCGTGKGMWGPRLVGANLAGVYAPEIAKGKIFALQTSSSSYPSIHGIDGKTGNTFWVHKGVGNIVSSLLFDRDRLYFATSTGFRQLDTVTGKTIVETKMPQSMSGTPDLPDRVMSRGNTIIVAKEKNGVIAFAKDKDQILWYQHVGGNYEFARFWYATRKKVLAKYVPALGETVSAADRNSRWWGMWTESVEYQWSGYNSDKASRYRTTGRLGASMAMFQSSLAVSSIIRSVQIVAAVEGLVNRLQYTLNNSVKLHAMSLQGKYYIRPYKKRGLGIMIVDLDTGLRADFEYCAPNPMLNKMTMQMPIFVLDPEHNRLLTSGISLDTSNYQPYVKFKYTMPYPSILAFEPSKLKFGKTLWDNDRLASWAKDGKSDKIEQALKQGAWVDSRDSSGCTPLWMAASTGDEDLVRLLLKHGATVNNWSADYRYERSPIQAAAGAGHVQVVKILLAAGADPRGAREAAGASHPEIIKLLDQTGN